MGGAASKQKEERQCTAAKQSEVAKPSKVVKQMKVAKQNKAGMQSRAGKQMKEAKRSIHVEDDDNLALAFIPSIVHSLVTTQNFPDLKKSPIVDEASSICPSMTNFIGACLLADMSGLTQLSAKFCEQGLRERDDLLRDTSGFLGQYIRVVYAHGGDGKLK